jgi:adenylate kinase
MRKYIIMGVQGSGKGTQAKLLADVCTGPLVARTDDTADALRARLRDYHTKTRPVLELFRAKEVVVEVDASQPATDVQTDIRSRLGVG